MHTRTLLMVTLTAAAVLGAGFYGFAAGPEGQAARRARAQQLQAEGNFKEAYDLFHALATDPNDAADAVPQDLSMAVRCLQNLGRHDETDEFIQKVIAAHAENWRLLWRAGQTYQELPNHGFIIAGKFYRGGRRGNDGRYANSIERDRVRALQLMTQARERGEAAGPRDDAARGELSQFYFDLAAMLMNSRYGDGAWRLQSLTDLTKLPDYDEGYGYQRQTNGAPVDEAGNPLLHQLPESWEKARTDGERWRWCLKRAADLTPAYAGRAKFEFAGFLQTQFDVQSMADAGYGRFFGRVADDDAERNETGPFAVSTLGEDETIARLATGIRRFKLPADFNFVRIYRELFESEDAWAANAGDALGQLFEDRQQYGRAADYWSQTFKRFGGDHRRQRLEQVVGNWGTFEPVGVEAAGKGPRFNFRFRNGRKVHFEAHALDVRKLIEDVKTYINTKPQQLDWSRTQVDDIGYRVVQQNQGRYLGSKVAEWDVDLIPRPKHFDKRILLTGPEPLNKPGAYLLTSRMEGGNESRVVLWVADTTVVTKPLDGGTWYFVADAASGQPVAGAKLDFFGYQHRGAGDNRTETLIQEFSQNADADGQAHIALPDDRHGYNWLAVATAPGGRFAYHGFAGMWRGRMPDHDHHYNQTKVFVATDRPVYRPGQTVKFKVWVAKTQFDQDRGKSPFAGQAFTAMVRNPRGEKLLEQSYTADDFGGFDGELALPKEATLGVYALSLPGQGGGGSFRVEEYKKPEFEVTVEAPTEPVALGEKITATIESKYYFGAPVAQGKVKYKVTRARHDARWYPAGEWDWFYGPGYWWFAADYPWYPGWREWGCFRPVPWWWRGVQQPPEVVMENEVPVGEGGVVKVEIDTAVAKAAHGDSDHKYEITAEVTDQSRRTIVGQGSVIAARKPFKVYAWVDRGHYEAGDVVRADFSAQTLDNKPVKGPGVLKLLRVSYDQNMKPAETEVGNWELATNDQGRATQQMKPAQPGQYRLSYAVDDGNGHVIEGGYLLTVRGGGFTGREHRFNDIELVPDQRQYAPGDTVRLMVNTNRPGAAVALFVRPANGVYLPPQILRPAGKSTTVELGVVAKDMPNFFVEAVTVADGNVYTETREIVVPPASRVVNVAVAPSAQRYKPGERAKVQIKLTDANGEPVVGSAVVSVYDKSVEYVSGGSNVPEIRAHFWKWRRQHRPNGQANLRHAGPIVKINEVGMAYLGRFGHLVADVAPEGGEGELAWGDRFELESRGYFARGVADYRFAEGMGGAPARPMALAAAPTSGGGLFANAAEMDAAPPSSQPGGPAGPGEPGAGPQGALVEPTVRKNFADTALWVASLTTDANGVAEVELDMPENLTTWRTRVWTMSQDTRVGEGSAEVVTAKDLLVRLQAPRFFVQRDEVVLSANVHNYLKSEKQVRVSLETPGPYLAFLGSPESATQTVSVPAGGERRVDWRVKVAHPGQAVVRMTARTDEESDAMEMSFPVYVHGMLKTESYAGAMRPGDKGASLTVNVPRERIVEQSVLEIRYSPSVAAAMVDALPYLADYPYGCTEQTLNRFVPTVITRRTLLAMGLDLNDVAAKRTNLNAQQVGDDRQRAQDWARRGLAGQPDRNPVFDEAALNAMVRAGVDRLASMQCGDGGWGWFSGAGEQSYPHTTAVVVHGLQLARECDVPLPDNMLERGVAWLKLYQEREAARVRAGVDKQRADNLDAFVHMVLADAGEVNAEMRDLLYRDRNDLSVYAKAVFGLALQKQEGQGEKLAMVLRNIGQYLVQDDENQTAYLRLPEDSHWWHWYGSDTEANAYYLKLLSRTDPQGPVAPKLAKYLVNSRRNGTWWRSTRDTAYCVEALAEYVTASGEDRPDMRLTVLLDGKKLKEVRINAANFFSFDNRVVLSGADVPAGEHRIEFVKEGTGPLYFNAYLTNFTLEDPITRAGLEIKVDRKFYKLVRSDRTEQVAGSRGQAVGQRVERYERRPLKDGDTLDSGDLVEVELEIDSKNDYEYVIFEDLKAAGFEPVEVRSGYNGNDLGAYVEFRDERVCFFTRTLARGKHSVAYRLRAEVPGKFSALPARASAMYAPELRANSDENKLSVRDAPTEVGRAGATGDR